MYSKVITVGPTANICWCFRMVRAYKRKLGSGQYADYSKERLEECLDSIRNGIFTQRRASLHFNIRVPRRTINYNLKEKHVKLPGKQPVFSRDEKKHLYHTLKL